MCFNSDHNITPSDARSCLAHGAVLAKVLRLKMKEIKALLTFDPEVKVIYLVRDPRAISVSRAKAK